MVNAAKDISYGKEFYKQGDKLPPELVKLFEIHNPSLLDNFIEINAKWTKIDDPSIAGWVEENKRSNLRLQRFFNIKPEVPIIVKPKPKPKPKAKYTGITFKKLVRKKQEKELTKLGISYSKKDKEKDLIRKYLKNV